MLCSGYTRSGKCQKRSDRFRVHRSEEEATVHDSGLLPVLLHRKYQKRSLHGGTPMKLRTLRSTQSKPKAVHTPEAINTASHADAASLKHQKHT